MEGSRPVYPPPFRYERPESVDETIELLARHHGQAKVLAGGHSLLPSMKLRDPGQPSLLVDVNRLDKLDGGVSVNGAVTIPSLTHHIDVARNEHIRQSLPQLVDVASRIGDPQVRNAGTVGGAVAEIYPGGDWAPALIALGAELVCRGADGERRIPAAEQFVSDTEVALSPQEVLVAIEVPNPVDGQGGVHLRLERRTGIAVTNCSIRIELDDQGAYRSVTAAWGGLRRGPVVATGLDDVLLNHQPGDDVHRAAAERALGATESFSDVRGSEGYRKKVAKVLLRRGLDAAARRANGQKVEVRDVI